MEVKPWRLNHWRLNHWRLNHWRLNHWQLNHWQLQSKCLHVFEIHGEVFLMSWWSISKLEWIQISWRIHRLAQPTLLHGPTYNLILINWRRGASADILLKVYIVSVIIFRVLSVSIFFGMQDLIHTNIFWKLCVVQSTIFENKWELSGNLL